MKRFLIVLSLLWATSASAQFTTTSNYGFKKPNSGLANSWDAYLNGDFDLLDTLLGGGATTAAATYNVGDLACVTATNTVGSCGSAAANLTFIGVLLAKNGTRPVWTALGVTLVNSNASASFVAGDIVCSDPSNGGKVIDNGALPCGGSTTEVGVSIVSDGNVTSHAIVMSQGTTGGTTGALPTVSASTQGQILSNNGVGGAWDGARLQSTEFSGADASVRIQACFARLKLNNAQGGICDASGEPLTQTLTLNPFAVSTSVIPGASNNIPTSGELWLPCGGNWSVNTGIIMPNRWSMRSCLTTNVNGQAGFNFVASGSFPNPTSPAGTVTMGTPGISEVITGSGTAFSASWIGCNIVSPATQPTVANSTFGNIVAVGSTTSMTLAFGTNNGTGAPGGSTFAIICPVIMKGNGAVGGAESGINLIGIGADCNNLITGIGILNWFSQENSVMDHWQVRGCPGVGMLVETNGAQNSGPYEVGEVINNSAGCTANTIPIVYRSGNNPIRGLGRMTISFGGSCGTQPNVGIDAGTPNQRIYDVFCQSITTCVEVGANLSCPVACATPPRSAPATRLEGITGGISGTSVVDLSSAILPPTDDVISDIYVSSGFTNALVDHGTGCSETASRLGLYAENHSGGIGYSTSMTAGCQPVSTQSFQFFCTGTATSSSVLFPFPFNSTGASTCTITTDIGRDYGLNQTCTLRNLSVRAGTGGVAADTVQVFANGSAVLTAAIGTGTSANSGTTSATYTTGTSLRVAITTGVSTTLANVTGTFTCGQ